MDTSPTRHDPSLDELRPVLTGAAAPDLRKALSDLDDDRLSALLNAVDPRRPARALVRHRAVTRVRATGFRASWHDSGDLAAPDTVSGSSQQTPASVGGDAVISPVLRSCDGRDQ